MQRSTLAFLTLFAAFAFAGCGGGKPADGKAPAPQDHGHHHEAPHGGTLVVLGDHFAHLELVLDADAGKLTAYVLDGEAQKSVRLAQPDISTQLTLGEGETAQHVDVALKAQASELTGEKAGDSSEFSGQSDALKGVPAFGVLIKELKVKGQTITDLKFSFPEGNEDAAKSDAHAGHDHKGHDHDDHDHGDHAH